MSKTLSTILTIFKVARIIAKILFILSIIGAAGCAVALITLPLAGTIPSEILALGEVDFVEAYAACIVGAIVCAGEIIITYLSHKYFKNVLEAGTPFTFVGSKECFRLGLTSIITSCAMSIATGIVVAIYELMVSGGQQLNVESSISLSMGLFFMFMSLLFKHGAEQSISVNENTYEESEQK